MSELIKEAKKVIREASERGRPIILFSGGKDSLTTLLITLETLGDAEALYMDSSITLPGDVDYNKRVCRKLGVKLHIVHPAKHYQGDFAYQVRRWGYFPTINRTWCLIRLKVRPQRAYLRSVYGYECIYKLSGVRRYESSRRRAMYKPSAFTAPDQEHSGSFLVSPILNWRDEDVLEYLTQHPKIEPNPGYHQYGVSGCKWCPYYQPEIYQRVHALHPGIYDDIIALENEIGKPSVTGHLWLGELIRNNGRSL